MPGQRKLTHAARVLRLRELLDARPYLTIEHLRREFGVSRRTVYNDLEALQLAGVPVYSELGPTGEAQWKLHRSGRRPLAPVTPQQLLSFGLATAVLCSTGLGLRDGLEALLLRAGHGLPPFLRPQLDELFKRAVVVPRGVDGRPERSEIVGALFCGLVNQELVELWYEAGPQRAARHLVAPLSFLFTDGALYLVGESHPHGPRLAFRLEQIVKARWCQGKGFYYPADYRGVSLVHAGPGPGSGEPVEIGVASALPLGGPRPD